MPLSKRDRWDSSVSRIASRDGATRRHDGAAARVYSDAHMARVQLYLPDDLHLQAKAKGLLLSNLLQGAVRAALREERLGSEMDRYLTELREEVGEPSKLAKKRATAWAERVLTGNRARATRRPRRAA